MSKPIGSESEHDNNDGDSAKYSKERSKSLSAAQSPIYRNTKDDKFNIVSAQVIGWRVHGDSWMDGYAIYVIKVTIKSGFNIVHFDMTF